MKNLLSVACLGMVLATSCSTRPEPPLPHAFVYTGRYYPSFLPGVIVTIQTADEQGSMTRLVYAPNSDSSFTAIDSTRLTADDVRYFFAQLADVPLLRLAPEERPGFDGISVYNEVWQDGQSNTFRFWSPRKATQPQEHKVVEAVLGLYRRKFTTLPQQEYVESLEQYFDFGLPCKITSTDPLEVRMYGSLSVNEDEELTAFIRQLPSDKPILVDVTNFRGMGTMFYHLFRELMQRNPQIVWVCPLEKREQLNEMKVPAEKMVTTVAAGRDLIKKLPTDDEV